jgi:hypothetical protein
MDHRAHGGGLWLDDVAAARAASTSARTADGELFSISVMSTVSASESGSIRSLAVNLAVKTPLTLNVSVAFVFLMRHVWGA